VRDSERSIESSHPGRSKIYFKHCFRSQCSGRAEPAEPTAGRRPACFRTGKVAVASPFPRPSQFRAKGNQDGYSHHPSTPHADNPQSLTATSRQDSEFRIAPSLNLPDGMCSARFKMPADSKRSTGSMISALDLGAGTLLKCRITSCLASSGRLHLISSISSISSAGRLTCKLTVKLHISRQ